ncbi:hypothetical protein VNO78_34412 [Psophocarpus tetragonolobus]|uniref:Uncharacterized protein n=1 Tax=Psophocarpus tetragonolobus TaxID=3891 RepID=A0AAN9NVM1_PSOTE
MLDENHEVYSIKQMSIKQVELWEEAIALSNGCKCNAILNISSYYNFVFCRNMTSYILYSSSCFSLL